MSGETKYLSFSIEGDFVTNLAREKLYEDKDLGAALRLLRSCTESDQLTSDEQLMICLHILHGSMSIVGNSSDDSYGVEERNNLETRPTELSSIATLISDMDQKIKFLEAEISELSEKLIFAARNMSEFELKTVNADYYNETGKPMFPGIRIPNYMKDKHMQNTETTDILDSFMKQRRRENEAIENGEEPECDYGWLEPNGTWHPVEWGQHSKWAQDWLNEHMPFKSNPSIYWWTDSEGDRHHITDRDVLIRSLNWILLDNPYQGLAQIRRDLSKRMTTKQREFLYEYFTKRDRIEDVNALNEMW